MFTKLTENDISWLVDGELGINSLKFIQIVSQYASSKFVDIGVETGKSSMILLNDAVKNNNHVWGVDPIRNVRSDILANPNYHFLQSDSVECGKNWKNGEVDVVFFDSIHADVQVMSELKYWWKLIKVGGWAIFHDTNWENYIHKPNHPCAGRKPGNSGMGYDFYAGIAWATPDKAVKEFFKVDSFNYKDDNIQIYHGEQSLGMTFIKKLSEKDYSTETSEQRWIEINNMRQILLKGFGA